MEHTLPPASFSDLKTQNMLEDRFLTIILSQNLLEKPLPLRCMFCGEHLKIAIHRTPKAIVDTKYMTKDCDPLVDVRCKSCKLNYRIAY